MPNAVLLIQARLGSTRLPSKILATFCGVPMLVYQTQRLQQSGVPVHVLAPRGDLQLVPLRQHLYLHFIRGEPNDVLARYATYARAFLTPGTLIARACGDTPLLCPMLLRTLLAYWNATPGLAYLGMGCGWPDGLADYDIFTWDTLMAMDAEATIASDREHIVPYAWRYPERFPQMTYPASDWVRAQQWPKLSVDTPDDLAYVERVAQATQAVYGKTFTWVQVLDVLQHTPDLARASEPMNPAYTAQVAQEQGTPERTWEEQRYGTSASLP